MATTALMIIMTLVAQTTQTQVQMANSPAVEAHIRDIIKQLPVNSELRQSLLHGAYGNGVHHPWMDEMRRLGVKRAVMWIDIRFDRKGKAKQTTLNHTEYFSQYEGGTAISDENQLKAIRASGLDKDLTTFALKRAKHGFWPDLPRPRPHPFIGGAQVQLLDDEWLPGPSAPLYYTR